MNYISTSKLIPRAPLKVELNLQNSVKYTSPCCIHPHYFVALGSLSNVEVMLFHYLGGAYFPSNRPKFLSFFTFALKPHVIVAELSVWPTICGQVVKSGASKATNL